MKFDVIYMIQDTNLRVAVMNITFILFNVVCFYLLRYHPDFLWKDNYDRAKVVIYTYFLFTCVLYHIIDSVILSFSITNWINYLLLLSGDLLVIVLIFNFMNCNYVFTKSEEIKKQFEESETQIAQQYFEKEELKKLSEFDFLTNSYSRREISSIMQDNIKNGHKLVCVFIDLDGLKQANDKYGHTFGDMMLKRFADATAEILSDKGYLARIGGDEFLLIFPDQEISYIENLITELQAKLLEPTDDKDKVFFSYGISYNEATVDDYIVLADKRMYECKKKKAT